MNRLILTALLLTAPLIMSGAAFGKPVIHITNGNSPFATKTWMTAAWTGDSAPYAKIREDIDNRVVKGESVESIVEQDKVKAQKNRLDPYALFAYGYAAHKSHVADPTSGIPGDVYEWVSENKVENVYEYTRLRFMLAQESYPNADNYYLKGLGERLLKRNPDDEQVRMDLVYALCTDEQGLGEALSVASDAVSKHPDNPKVHTVLTSVYSSMFTWGNESDANLAKKGVAEYQKYLDLAPANDWYRKYALMHIKYLELKRAK